MDNTNYKAALQTLRRILDQGFYDTDYAIKWINLVLDGKQDPTNSMTPAVLQTYNDLRASYPNRR
jgi:hypothetical protein